MTESLMTFTGRSPPRVARASLSLSSDVESPEVLPAVSARAADAGFTVDTRSEAAPLEGEENKRR